MKQITLYLEDVMRRLEEEFGKQKWDLQILFEEASGADPNVVNLAST